jgi:hypothetical protein
MLGCNDDDPNNPCGTAPPWASTVTVPVVAGNCYKVRVGGWSDADEGIGMLNITCACSSDPDCDDGDPCTADTCIEGACDNSPADCNDNGIPDCDDIANETSADCNGNSIPDECEEDCNANGLADECDIADCPPETPACDDCNLNGVPDECDIDSGLSEDVDMNGVPDECCEAQVSGDWSEDIWCVDEGYPDNDPKNPVGVPDLSVTLAGEGLTVFADVTVEIPSLRLINAASLDVTNDGEQGDLTIGGRRSRDQRRRRSDHRRGRHLQVGHRFERPGLGGPAGR